MAISSLMDSFLFLVWFRFQSHQTRIKRTNVPMIIANVSGLMLVVGTSTFGNYLQFGNTPFIGLNTLVMML